MFISLSYSVHIIVVTPCLFPLQLVWVVVFLCTVFIGLDIGLLVGVSFSLFQVIIFTILWVVLNYSTVVCWSVVSNHKSKGPINICDYYLVTCGSLVLIQVITHTWEHFIQPQNGQCGLINIMNVLLEYFMKNSDTQIGLFPLLLPLIITHSSKIIELSQLHAWSVINT